jgi:hypothetical protein
LRIFRVIRGQAKCGAIEKRRHRRRDGKHLHPARQEQPAGIKHGLRHGRSPRRGREIIRGQAFSAVSKPQLTAKHAEFAEAHL